MKTMERFYENIWFRLLTSEIVDVKRKKMENGDFKTFNIDFLWRKSTTSTNNTHSNVTFLPCPINGQDKDQLLSELCNIDDGSWVSNKLNEMIILAKYERSPTEGTKKYNWTLAALTC